MIGETGLSYFTLKYWIEWRALVGALILEYWYHSMILNLIQIQMAFLCEYSWVIYPQNQVQRNYCRIVNIRMRSLPTSGFGGNNECWASVSFLSPLTSRMGPSNLQYWKIWSPMTWTPGAGHYLLSNSSLEAPQCSHKSRNRTRIITRFQEMCRYRCH